MNTLLQHGFNEAANHIESLINALDHTEMDSDYKSGIISGVFDNSNEHIAAQRSAYFKDSVPANAELFFDESERMVTNLFITNVNFESYYKKPENIGEFRHSVKANMQMIIDKMDSMRHLLIEDNDDILNAVLHTMERGIADFIEESYVNPNPFTLIADLKSRACIFVERIHSRRELLIPEQAASLPKPSSL